MANTYITPGFRNLDIVASKYFLDTNVWSTLAVSEKATSNFSLWLKSNDSIAALSMYTIFELSRANKLHKKLDQLLTQASTRVYIPLLYDELSDLEMENYPDYQTELMWSSVENYKDYSGVKLITKLSKDPRFINKRQEFLDFGFNEFLNLEHLKKNFPFEDENGSFSSEHGDTFAWATSIDFLVRHFPSFLVPYKGNLDVFDPKKLTSLYFRSLFLYYKFYIHGQKPNKSDFMDFAHVSYIPYIDSYVTERNVFNVLSHMKSVHKEFKTYEPIHVEDFVQSIENWSD
jgi:hypothetical protein